ncbi:hypothetical protein V1527DRAFT_468618 [Lipomyces starkeyi]
MFWRIQSAISSLFKFYQNFTKIDEPGKFINNVATFLSAIAQAFAQHLLTLQVFSTICLSFKFSSQLSFTSFSICYSFLSSLIFVSAR